MVRTPNNNSYRYAPVTAPISASDFPLWAENEFRNIKGALDIIASGGKEKLYVAPLKPRDGDFAYADGSSWNPGYGAGLYYYNGTSWLFVSPEYITGSWTPTISGITFTGANSSTYRYTKVGRLVTIHITLTAATSVAIAANATISMPFSVHAYGAGTGMLVNINNAAQNSLFAATTTGGVIYTGFTTSAGQYVVLSCSYYT